MEISKMMTMNYCHVTSETYKALLNGEGIDVLSFVSNDYPYPEEFGVIINCCYAEYFEGEATGLPHDLMMCMSYANKHGCNWLRLCEDGERVRGLRWYYGS